MFSQLGTSTAFLRLISVVWTYFQSFLRKNLQIRREIIKFK
jgi:hypothetical protein